MHYIWLRREVQEFEMPAPMDPQPWPPPLCVFAPVPFVYLQTTNHDGSYNTRVLTRRIKRAVA